MSKKQIKKQIKCLRGQAKFPGIVAAAAMANISRQHLYLCLTGQRTASAKVRLALAEHPLFASYKG